MENVSVNAKTSVSYVRIDLNNPTAQEKIMLISQLIYRYLFSALCATGKNAVCVQNSIKNTYNTHCALIKSFTKHSGVQCNTHKHQVQRGTM